MGPIVRSDVTLIKSLTASRGFRPYCIDLQTRAKFTHEQRPMRKVLSTTVLVGLKQVHCLGSGCGSVGRAVASDTRDPRFESSH